MTIVFGLGGVLTEALRQVAVRLAPIAEAEARAMVAAVPALAGIFAPRADASAGLDMLVAMLLRLSQLAVELAADIAELDLNPVIVDAATMRATIVDALIIARNDAGRGPGRGEG